MRKFLPLAGIGCVAIIVIGLVVGGAIMLGYGISGFFKKSPPQNKSAPLEKKGAVNGVGAKAESLNLARKGFTTQYFRPGFFLRKAPDAPAAPFRTVQYPSGANFCEAYLGHRPGPDAMPAVIWVHPGLDGLKKNDLAAARVFEEAGFVTLCPSFRGEHKNAGKQEFLFGEVDDLLAAVEFLKSNLAVDSKRIYFVGAGEGATLTLLGATTGSTDFRAAFCLGGWLDVPPQHLESSLPVDLPREQRMLEYHLRSPHAFLNSIMKPTFLITPERADEIAQLAKEKKLPIQSVPISLSAGHPDQHLLELIRDKIAADRGPECRIEFSATDRERIEARRPMK